MLAVAYSGTNRWEDARGALQRAGRSPRWDEYRQEEYEVARDLLIAVYGDRGYAYRRYALACVSSEPHLSELPRVAEALLNHTLFTGRELQPLREHAIRTDLLRLASLLQTQADSLRTRRSGRSMIELALSRGHQVRNPVPAYVTRLQKEAPQYMPVVLSAVHVRTKHMSGRRIHRLFSAADVSDLDRTHTAWYWMREIVHRESWLVLGATLLAAFAAGLVRGPSRPTSPRRPKPVPVLHRLLLPLLACLAVVWFEAARGLGFAALATVLAAAGLDMRRRPGQASFLWIPLAAIGMTFAYCATIAGGLAEQAARSSPELWVSFAGQAANLAEPSKLLGFSPVGWSFPGRAWAFPGALPSLLLWSVAMLALAMRANCREGLAMFAAAGFMTLGIMATLAVAMRLQWTAQNAVDGRGLERRIEVMHLGPRQVRASVVARTE